MSDGTGSDRPIEQVDWQCRLHPEVWAKSPDKVNLAPGEGLFHPLVCHMIDTAVVAERLWHQVLPAALREQTRTGLGVASTDEAGRWVAFFVGLHDLGKATPDFARRWAEGWTALWALGFRAVEALNPVTHGVLTAEVLEKLLPQLGVPPAVALPVATVLGGHHGRFPPLSDLNRARRFVGGGMWEIAQADLLHALAHALGVDQLQRPTGSLNEDIALLLVVAGLTSVSDWIASDHRLFPFAGGAIRLDEYQRRAESQAAAALEQLGWTARPAPGAPRTFAELFGREPNPLQQQVIELAPALTGPSMVLLEYPMGGGKTEAALYLADLMAFAAGHSGFYFALPTMATSNQMLSRVDRYLSARFPSDWVNVQLLHGHADLNAEFTVLRQTGAELLQPGGIFGGSGAGLLAAEWFTYRKRGLLAPYGIGTIDQALLAALQTNHFFVRLFGLAGKVVILDEIHAYDTYMQTLLGRLLTWLAACGSSVILLSATLPALTRQNLMTAYAEGRERTVALADVPYPRLSWLTDSATDVRHVEAHRTHSVALERFPQQETGWMDKLVATLAVGGCAAVILNTVTRAQDVYQQLQERFAADELYLFHARAPYDQRAQWEAQVLKRFGNDAAGRPFRTVVVATQVIEQSLDLDFDLMLSDLAPIDLLLQRSGRLWRHPKTKRPPTLTQPSLWLLMPPVDQDGVPRFDPGSRRVYDGHTLLRTWLALDGETALAVPAQVDDLIERVYRPCAAPPKLPGALREYWAQSWAKLQADQDKQESEAERRYIPAPTGDMFHIPLDSLDEDDETVHPVFQALTRLTGRPSVQVVCLRSDGGMICTPGAGQQVIDLTEPPAGDKLRALLGSSLSISFHPRIVRRILGLEPPQAWQRSPHLRRHRCLLFDPQGNCLTADLPLKLDSVLGLVLPAPREEEES